MISHNLSLVKEKIRTTNILQDIEEVIQDLNFLARNPSIDNLQAKEIKKLKQRAYERKFHMKNEVLSITKPTQQEEQRSLINSCKKINYYKETLLFLFGLLVSILLWLQSLGIYQSLGFSCPKLIAFGAIIMTIGFSYFSVDSKKFYPNLMNGVVVIYETLLIISGTILNENDISLNKAKSEVRYIQLLENYRQGQSDYETLKTKYYDKTSNLFMNAWYKKQYLNPLIEKREESLTALTQMEEKIQEEVRSKNYIVIFIKILYRMSLVILLIFINNSIFREIVFFTRKT